MDPLRQAFQKIKQEINNLNNEVKQLKNQINQINQQIRHEFVQKIPLNIEEKNQTIPTQIPFNNTCISNRQTHNEPFKAFKSQKKPFSTGNEGVPTDRQTDQQTAKYLENNKLPEISDDFEKARKILDSLDNIKKEIRLKFKQLTPQEMLIFSTLYTLEEKNIGKIDYKHLADNLNLSESSIRDYIIKLIKKGIPIQKTRQNNKKITLSISENLKKTATLSTIIQLRDL